MQFGGLLTHPMHAPVHIGIHVKILVAHGVEHAKRLLCGCGIIEIYQRLIVNGTAENGKVGPYFIDIVHNV